jgi:hypothetical protein
MKDAPQEQVTEQKIKKRELVVPFGTHTNIVLCSGGAEGALPPRLFSHFQTNRCPGITKPKNMRLSNM